MEEGWARERGPCVLAEVYAMRVDKGLKTNLRLMFGSGLMPYLRLILLNRATMDLVGRESLC